MIATTQKKALHSILANKLNKLTIPPTSDEEFHFSDLFGPPTSSSSPFLGDPPIIHNRSHSFVGPSPRFAVSNSLPEMIEIDSESSDEDGDDEDSGIDAVRVGEKGEDGVEVCRIGPGDFKILMVVGKGAFGKVFKVRKKDRDGISGIGGDR